MKYLVTVKMTSAFCLEVSAKDEDAAREKAEAAWEKVSLPQIEGNKLGKFEHVEEDIEFDVEEA